MLIVSILFLKMLIDPFACISVNNILHSNPNLLKHFFFLK
jgi:hypothetical protein